MTEKLYGNPEQICLFEKPQLDTSPAGCDTIREELFDSKNIEKIKNAFSTFTDCLKHVGMRDATPEEIECIDKHIKERSYPTGVSFWDNWHLSKDDITGINEIDTYISEINSQDNFIAKVNSLPMWDTPEISQFDDKWKEAIDKMNEVPNNYPHEDDRFYIPKEYKNMTVEELRIEKEKLFKELKGEKTDERN